MESRESKKNTQFAGLTEKESSSYKGSKAVIKPGWRA